MGKQIHTYKVSPKVVRMTHQAACGRMVNRMGLTSEIQKVTCKGCLKNS